MSRARGNQEMVNRCSTYKLAQILERMTSTDKDLRYMAISDLMGDTEKNEIIFDDDGERKVVRHVLKLLDDKSSEVQNIVIKCLGVLAPKLNKTDMLSFLLNNLIEMASGITGEIHCTAAKTVYNSLSPTRSSDGVSAAVVQSYPKLIQKLESTEEVHASELMDIVSDLLIRYGSKLASYHDITLMAIVLWINRGRSMIRKRATQALGSLTTCASNELFNTAFDQISDWLNSKPSDQSKMRNYVMAANYVCRSKGSQFVLRLGEILPQMKATCINVDDEDIREAVLTTLDTFIYFCSGGIEPYEADIQKILLQYISHDPNYCGGDGDDEEMPSQGLFGSWERGDEITKRLKTITVVLATSLFPASDDEYDDDEDAQYSDTDDDLSWKVRRSCAKALGTEVKYLNNKGAKLISWMKTVSPVLVDRLKDREDHVLIEIVNALKEMVIQIRRFLPEEGSENVDSFGDVSGELEASCDQITVRQLLEEIHPKMIGGLAKIVGKKTTITRNVVFELLIELTRTLSNKLTGEFVYNVAKSGFEDKSGGSQIKMITLAFITAALKTNEPETFLGFVPQLTEALVKAVDDNFYKIVSEAVAVLSRFSTVLKKAKEIDPSRTAEVNSVYNLLEKLLNKIHGDQEVLYRAITAAGTYLATLGDGTNPKEGDLLLLLTTHAEKAAVDQTCTVSALRALKAIAENTNIKAVFKVQLERILSNLANLIEKNGAAAPTKTRDSVTDIQNAILELTATILSSQDASRDSDGLKRLILALPALLREAELVVSFKALTCMHRALEMGLYDASFAPAIVKLFESHLLTGVILDTAISTNTALAKELMKGGTNYETILDALTAPVYDRGQLSKQAYRSIAMATADIAAATGNKEGAVKLAAQLIGHLRTNKPHERLFSILALGELGRAFPDVYNGGDLKPEQLLFEIFSNQTDELRPDAAQALGGLAAGNPSRFLPFILSHLKRATTAQLPLLNAIKEVLNTSKHLEPSHLDQIWPVLVDHTDVQEESVRSVVADCIGKLCNDNPVVGLEALQKLLTDSRVNVRYTAVTAFKVIVFDGYNVKNKMLSPYLESIGDAVRYTQDHRVRRIGLIVLNALFRKRTQLMRIHVSSIMPSIYKESKILKELIREVEMGPFKHQVDDGVDLRKAAYECMHTIMEKCSTELNMEEFIKNLEDGLKDSNHDIKLQTAMILCRLCTLAPATLLQAIPSFSEHIKCMLQAKPKQNAVRQEVEKIEEMKKALIRVVKSMEKIPDADRQLAEILNYIQFQNDLKQLAEQVEKDDREGAGAMEM